MRSPESPSEKRRPRAELSGMEQVFYENLLGNRTFPQRGPAIFALTLDALMSQKDPEAALREYLFTPLSEKRAQEFYDAAIQAHLSALPPDRQPEIDIKKTLRLWEVERQAVGAFIHTLLMGHGYFTDDEHDGELEQALSAHQLPVSDIKILTGAMKEYLKEPDTVARLKEYRRAFKEGRWLEAEIIGLGISKKCIVRAREAINKAPLSNAAIRVTILGLLEGIR